MKPSYSADNTRSPLVIIALLAGGITLVALLLGLSDKPDIVALGIAPTVDEVAAAGQVSQADQEFEPDTDGDSLADDAQFSTPSTAASTSAEVPASTDEGASTTEAQESEPVATAIAVTPIPIEVEPTPEIAAAVAIDPDDGTVGGSGGAVDDDFDAAFAATTVSPGTIAGQFFTSPDEDDGAIVHRNELTISLEADGTGSFAGVLEMTLIDSTAVQIAMSGPIRWSNDTPQVSAEVSGTFTHNSPIDADDLSSETGELNISSLGSGSGSLCPETCYGFTFTPQTGF